VRAVPLESPAQVGRLPNALQAHRGRDPPSAEARHRRSSNGTHSTDKPQETRAWSAQGRGRVAIEREALPRHLGVVTDYRGLTVRQLEDLRGRLRAEGIDYIVVKNTLARRAAVDAGAAGFRRCPERPRRPGDRIRDLSAPARILFEHFRSTRTLPLVAGLAEGQVLDSNAVRTLAELPSRDVLLSRLAAALLGPLSMLAASLDSPLSTLAATLEAYRDKLAA